MAFDKEKILNHFHLLGLSHNKTPIQIREKFFITDSIYENILRDARVRDIEGIVCVSTCNRTEIYAYIDKPNILSELLLSHSTGNKTELRKYGYLLSGHRAIKHIFEVVSGLDSQILGDFQVVGQIRTAFNFSKKRGMINSFMNRMFTHIFHSNKIIKNKTGLSKGTTSIAHAAVKYIKDNKSGLSDSNFLLYGIGNIGKVTCVNLVKHIHNKNLVLINRTKTKAEDLAKKVHVIFKDESFLKTEVAKANVIIVATNADNYTLKTSHFNGYSNKKLVLDLSVPRNVQQEVSELEGITLVGLEQLSQENKEVLEKRKNSIPIAKQIIENEISVFYEWLEIHHLSPVFQAVQNKLIRIKEEELSFHKNKMSEEEFKKTDIIATNLVHKIARITISHIRKNYKSKDLSLKTIDEIFNQ